MAGPIAKPNDNPSTSYFNYFSLASRGPSTASTPAGAGVEKRASEVDMGAMFSFDAAGDNDPSSFSSGTSDLNALEGLFYASSGDWCTFDEPQPSVFM
jgi:hypothetical protein